MSKKKVSWIDIMGYILIVCSIVLVICVIYIIAQL